VYVSQGLLLTVGHDQRTISGIMTNHVTDWLCNCPDGLMVELSVRQTLPNVAGLSALAPIPPRPTFFPNIFLLPVTLEKVVYMLVLNFSSAKAHCDEQFHTSMILYSNANLDVDSFLQ
jgi:hypothetical protein